MYQDLPYNPDLPYILVHRIIQIYPISRLTINEFNEFMRQQIVLTRRFTVFSHLPYFQIYRVPRFTVFPDLLYTRFTALAHTQVYRIIQIYRVSWFTVYPGLPYNLDLVYVQIYHIIYRLTIDDFNKFIWQQIVLNRNNYYPVALSICWDCL